MNLFIFEEVMLDPAHYFMDPDALLSYLGFDTVQKHKILKAWELDITLLQVCDEENMGSEQDIRFLSRIHQAIHDIEEGLDK